MQWSFSRTVVHRALQQLPPTRERREMDRRRRWRRLPGYLVAVTTCADIGASVSSHRPSAAVTALSARKQKVAPLALRAER